MAKISWCLYGSLPIYLLMYQTLLKPWSRCAHHSLICHFSISAPRIVVLGLTTCHFWNQRAHAYLKQNKFCNYCSISFFVSFVCSFCWEKRGTEINKLTTKTNKENIHHHKNARKTFPGMQTYFYPTPFYYLINFCKKFFYLWTFVFLWNHKKYSFV